MSASRIFGILIGLCGRRLCHNYLTGSSPPSAQGLQRMIRQMPIPIPLMHPYFSIAWAAYSEQVGVNRQVLGQKRLEAC